MTLESKFEAILFAAAMPFSIKRLAELTESDPNEVRKALDRLSVRLDDRNSALMLQQHGNEVELVTRPEVADLVSQVIKAETQGELTRPQLEALTILAYRGPLTRPEVEQIRGVQSALILRNLMLRGLVQEDPSGPLGQPTYSVTFDFINALGLKSLSDLPDYDDLRGNQLVQEVLNDLSER